MDATTIWLTNSLASLLAVHHAQIVGHARLVDDLGADSLDMVEMTMAIEDRFHVRIADDELDGIRRVDELLAFIDRKVAAR